MNWVPEKRSQNFHVRSSSFFFVFSLKLIKLEIGDVYCKFIHWAIEGTHAGIKNQYVRTLEQIGKSYGERARMPASDASLAGLRALQRRGCAHRCPNFLPRFLVAPDGLILWLRRRRGGMLQPHLKKKFLNKYSNEKINKKIKRKNSTKKNNSRIASLWIIQWIINHAGPE